MARLAVRAVLLLVFAGSGLLRATAFASADEIRLHSGEILHGEVVEAEGGRWIVRTASGERRVRTPDVAERLAAEAPTVELARREAALEAADADGRLALARFAWSRRLDEASARLAEEALALDPDHDGAHAWRGHVVTADGWAEGLPAPFGEPLDVGPRWERHSRPKELGLALAWLATHQDDDGRIDADGFDRHCPEGDACPDPGGGHHGERVPCGFDTATTAVALLAWLAAGSTPSSGPYRAAVGRATAFCVAAVQRGGHGFDGIWNLAFATQALADAALVSRDPALRDAAAEGVRRLVALQKPDGGWSYVHGVGDVPTTSIVCLALGVAAQAGIGIDPDRVEQTLAFLEARVEASSKRSEYHDGAERSGYTPTTANAAATLAARGYLGAMSDTPYLSARIGLLTKRRPKWELRFEVVKTRDGREVRAQIGNLYPYAWFLTTVALQARGGSKAAGWTRSIGAALRKGQASEGHAAGSWEPLGTYSSTGGRAFVTGLGALMLAASYRYAR